MSEEVDKVVKIEFEDGSTLEVSEHWITCVKMKYNFEWDEYWALMEQVIDGLWDKGKIWTKFGVEDMREHYKYEKGEVKDEGEELGELNRAWHAENCIYADMRSCLMALTMKLMSKEGEKVPKVIGISDDEVHVYDGEKMERKSIDEVFG